MSVKVRPDDPFSTHQVKLTHQGEVLGLVTCDYKGEPGVSKIEVDPLPSSAIKTYSGMQQYADMIPPWTPVAQSDFSGGMGQEDFDLDRFRYYDGYRIDSTIAGKLIRGPRAYYAKGLRVENSVWDEDLMGAMYMQASRLWYATAFTASENYKPTELHLICGTWRELDKPLTVEIQTDDNNKPSGTVVGSGSLAVSQPGVCIERVVKLNVPNNLVKGDQYHLVLKGPVETTTANFWRVVVWLNSNGYNYRYGGGEHPWMWENEGIYYRLVETGKTGKAFFGLLKEALYAGMSWDDGTTSKVYRNGEQGVASGGDAASLTDSTKSWEADQWKNALVVFRAGPGSGADENFRQITGNTDKMLSFAAADVAVGAGTEYCIVGTGVFTEVGDNPMTGSITHLLGKNDMLYFAMGDGEVIRRLRMYNSAGTWTKEWHAESANAKLLCAAADQTGPVVWKANSAAQIAKAAAVNGAGAGAAASLSFGSEISVGDLAERISSLTVYGDEGLLHVLKEAGVYAVVNDKPYMVPIYGMETTRDRRNGLASAVMGSYLYFSWHDRLMRYFVNDLRNIFPEGLPEGRYARVAAMEVYADRLYVAMDAGVNGTSSILAYNGLGMSEIYRAPAAGLRIRNMKIEPIPGNAVDRLWFSCGSDLMWVPIAYDPTTHPAVEGQSYGYVYESHLVTAWHSMGMWDIEKLFYSLKGIIEPVKTNTWIQVDYQVDKNSGELENGWKNIGGLIFGGDNQVFKKVLSEAYDVKGRRLRLRFVIANHWRQNLVMLGYVLEAMMKLPVIKTYSVTFRAEDRGVNVLGGPEEYGPVEHITGKLRDWAKSAYPAHVESVVSELHDKWVMIEPATVRVLDVIQEEGRQIYICNMRLVEVSGE